MRSTPRAVAGLLVAVGLLCGGCADGGDGPTGRSGDNATTTTTTSSPGGDMRSTLAAGLKDTSPVLSALVSRTTTTLDEVPLPAGATWKVIDVTSSTPPRPQRAFVGLHDSGRTVLLSGQPDSFATITQGLEVSTAADAVTLAVAYVDATRSMATLGYRVQKPADIRWRPKLTPAQGAVRDDVLARHGKQLAAPRAVEVEGGWSVTVWTVTGQELVQHLLTVRPDGTVTDVPRVVQGSLPVVIGI